MNDLSQQHTFPQEPGRLRVLAVDDERINLLLLKKLFPSDRYDLFQASSGAEGIALAKAILPDIILLDVMMPGVDGYEVCRELKKTPLVAGIPVIFISTRTDGLDLEAGFAAGAVDYITKPINCPELLARVNLHLEVVRDKRALAEANKELREINTNLARFLTLIAHDLRSPFSGFLTLPTLLSRHFDTLTREEIIEMANQMRIQARVIYDFLEDLLKWGMLQLGSIKFEPQHFPIHEWVESACRVAEPAARSKNISLSNRVQRGSIVFADVDMFSTIIRNLLSNAIKFTPTGGSISIASQAGSDLTKLSVTDTGIGIAPEKLAYLFRPGGYRSTLGTSQEKGTGFGLVLCKEFVEKHGGKIWVESEINHGTTFHFSFPNISKENRKMLEDKIFPKQSQQAPNYTI